MDIQKTEKNLPQTLQQLSQTELCRTLQEGNFKATSESLPNTIQKAIGTPVVNDLIKTVGKSQIVRFVEYELIKMASLVSVGNNLTNNQVQFIAVQLVDFFPNETLADFKLCFERGVMGQYGEIYRMDGIVIRKWMEGYLEEKYQVVENELMKEKDNMYKQDTSSDDEVAKKYINQMLENFKPTKRANENEIQHKMITNPYKYFYVRGAGIYATSQEHAEELAQKMIEKGLLKE